MPGVKPPAQRDSGTGECARGASDEAPGARNRAGIREIHIRAGDVLLFADVVTHSPPSARIRGSGVPSATVCAARGGSLQARPIDGRRTRL